MHKSETLENSGQKPHPFFMLLARRSFTLIAYAKQNVSLVVILFTNKKKTYGGNFFLPRRIKSFLMTGSFLLMDAFFADGVLLYLKILTVSGK